VAGNTREYLAYWKEQAHRMEIDISPLVSRGFNWLEANVPERAARTCLIHCDYGLHNILIDGDRVTALLDWEVSRAGDPAEDLSWFFSQSAGMVEPDDFLALYHEAGGQPVEEFNLRYFYVLRCVAMVVVCLHALRVIEERPAANINLALIGLQYVPHFAAQVAEGIRLAEQVHGSGRGKGDLR